MILKASTRCSAGSSSGCSSLHGTEGALQSSIHFDHYKNSHRQHQRLPVIRQAVLAKLSCTNLRSRQARLHVEFAYSDIVDRNITRQYGGTGLCLSIAKHLVLSQSHTPQANPEIWLRLCPLSSTSLLATIFTLAQGSVQACTKRGPPHVPTLTLRVNEAFFLTL